MSTILARAAAGLAAAALLALLAAAAPTAADREGETPAADCRRVLCGFIIF